MVLVHHISDCSSANFYKIKKQMKGTDRDALLYQAYHVYAKVAITSSVWGRANKRFKQITFCIRNPLEELEDVIFSGRSNLPGRISRHHLETNTQKSIVKYWSVNCTTLCTVFIEKVLISEKFNLRTT